MKTAQWFYAKQVQCEDRMTVLRQTGSVKTVRGLCAKLVQCEDRLYTEQVQYEHHATVLHKTGKLFFIRQKNEHALFSAEAEPA